MDVRRSARLVMAKMALVDDVITEEERALLGEEDCDELLDEARESSLPELLESVQAYPDRFFIALRAATLAHVDDDYDKREVALYERIVKLLEITPEDKEIIDRSVTTLGELGPEEPDPRIVELYYQSSFA